MSNQLTINRIKGSVITIDEGEQLLVRREFAEGLLDIESIRSGAPFKVENPLDGMLTFPDTAWLDEMLRQGRLRIVSDENGPIVTAKLADGYDHADILAKDPFAVIRRKVVRRLAEQGVSGTHPDLSSKFTVIWDAELAEEVAAICEANPKLKPMTRPEISTVRKWLGRGDPFEVTVADMMSHSGRVPRRARLSPEVIEIILNRSRWYYSSRGRKQKDVRAQIGRDIDLCNVERSKDGLPPLENPSKETIRRHIEAALCRDTFKEKWGEQAARARWDGAGRGLKAVKILSIALIDDTVLDAVSVFDADRNVPAGRPWLCVIMDVYSRCILGWVLSFSPPTVHTAAECLRRANRPKVIRGSHATRYPVLAQINGRMATLIADNGVNYVSPQFQQILADLGITLRLTAVGSPTHKAMIERFFLTLKTMLLQKLPGHALDPKLLKEFDIDPEKEAVLTLTEMQMLIQECINVYHISMHSGIDSQPANRWETSMRAHGRDVIADERKLTILTGVVKHNRRLYRGAIRMQGLVYRDDRASARLNDDLVGAEPHRKRVSSGAAVATVKIKFDPADLGEVHVWNHVAGEWVTLPCTDHDYAKGLSLWQHQQVKLWAAKRNLAFNTEAERLEAMRELNDLILELAPDMPARERRAVARMLGQPCAPADTASLAYAPARHDGMAPVIVHEVADNRLDGNQAPGRPAKAGPGDKRKARDEDAELTGDTVSDDDTEFDGDDELLVTDCDTPPVKGTTNDDERFEEFVL